MTINRKEFKFSISTVEKIEQLVGYEKSKNKVKEGLRVTQTDVVVNAINLAHSAAFGKDVFDQTLTKLSNVMRNTFESILREYAQPFGQALDSIYEVDNLNKEMMLLMLRANNILPDSEAEIKKIILSNEPLEEKIKDAIHFKDET